MEQSSLTIRACQPNEVERIVELVKATDLYYPDVDNPAAYRRQLRHDPESVQVAVLDGQVVGFIVLLYSPWYSLLYHLTVHEEHRRQGIGSRLVATAQDIVRQRGTALLGCYIIGTNTASLELHRKRGFQTDPLPDMYDVVMTGDETSG